MASLADNESLPRYDPHVTGYISDYTIDSLAAAFVIM